MTDKEIIEKAINRYGIESQMDMCIEEMSELTKAILKLRRYKNSINKEGITSDEAIRCGELVSDIEEEVADVSIMIEQMRLIFDDVEIKENIKFKLKRLQERMSDRND